MAFPCSATIREIRSREAFFIAAEGGYVNGKERLSAGILSATDGWMDGKGAYEPRNASQLIPYVSAHDNYTLWDKLKLSDPKRKEDAEPDLTRWMSGRFR